MKKILISLCLIVATVTMAVAQKTAESILQNYETITGLKTVDLSNPELSMMMEMVVVAQGNTIPMKMVMQGQNKFRIDMEAAGQKMLIIRNGDKGWMSMAGQIQPLPKEALDQQGEQTNVVASMKFDRDKYTYEYLGQDGGLDKVQITPVGKSDEGIRVAFFNSKGLIDKMTGKMEGKDFEMILSAYNKFGDITIPTVMQTKVADKVAATITVKDMEIDYPTAEWMFSEPTK